MRTTDSGGLASNPFGLSSAADGSNSSVRGRRQLSSTPRLVRSLTKFKQGAPMEISTSLLAVVIASMVMMYACNSFDDAASHLGRNMTAGVRGATINAVGSSMPELLTTFFLLFLFQDQGGFAAGIATTAGSAIFNAV
ncbi:MAG TPA: hypothetical protein ENI79_01900, partial [Rhodospirillales bacterium]|nr:hypothetical protein [Rhodospirillales bacterium]